MENSTLKDKSIKTIERWKSKMEALNLQMNLGAAEAKDEFERQKVSINKFIHEVNQQLDDVQEESKDKRRA